MIPGSIEEVKSSNLDPNARVRNKAPKRVYKSSDLEFGRKRKHFSSSQGSQQILISEEEGNQEEQKRIEPFEEEKVPYQM